MFSDIPSSESLMDTKEWKDVSQIIVWSPNDEFQSSKLGNLDVIVLSSDPSNAELLVTSFKLYESFLNGDFDKKLYLLLTSPLGRKEILRAGSET